MCAFYQSRHIGQHEGAITSLHDSKIGLQSGERIIGNLRPGSREARNQSRFAGVRKADEADIRQELEFQTKADNLTRMPFFMLGRRLVGRGRETGVTPAASSSCGDCEGLSGSREVKDLFAGVCVVNDSSNGNRKLDIFPISAGSVAAFSMPAAFGGMFRIEAEMEKRVVVLAGDQDNVSALAAITTARTTARNKLSLLNARHPLPPSPALTEMVTSSMNTGLTCELPPESHYLAGADRYLRGSSRELFLGGDYAYVFAEPATVAKLNRARHGGKQRVIFAQADVLSRLVACSALPDDDGATRDKLAGKFLYTEPLRI